MPETSSVSELKPAVPSFLTEKLPTLIAITTVILAVCTTLASFKAAGYGNRMVLGLRPMGLLPGKKYQSDHLSKSSGTTLR